MEAQKEHNNITKQTSAPWYYHKFFKYAVATLLVLTIILVFYKVVSFLSPIVDFISILFMPIVSSFLIYYLLRPIVYWLENWKIPRYISIICIYIIIAILLVITAAYVVPLLAKQVTELANISLDTLKKAQNNSEFVLFNLFHVNLHYEIQERLFNFVQQITTVLSKNLVDFLSFITRIAAILAVIPFIVFYLLKDDQDFVSGFLKYLPTNFGYQVSKILRNIDTTLSSYINGLVLVSSTLGLLLFIGYLMIGINYALILSIIAIIFTTIPFLGPFLAIAPAIFVAFSDSPWMVLKVLIVFIIIQQFESNFISPQIIGQRLHIHPLTIILLLLAAGSLYGLIGLILATPVYAISKILIENLYKIYQLRYSHWTEKLP